MTTMNDLFLEYLASIEPYPKAVKRAKVAHDSLREDLEADANIGSQMLNSFLSGSYGRSTAIKGIRDVDIVVPLNYTFAELLELCKQGETVQHCLLRLVQEAIERSGRYVESSTIRRRSILVKLTDDLNAITDDEPELTLDIVPVIPQTKASGQVDQYKDPLWIGDKDLCQWLWTYPNSQLADSEERNSKSSYLVDRHLYKPLVKIMRAWKKVNFGSQKTPKGFFMECMVAEFHNPNATNWLLAIRDMLRSACGAWGDPDYFTTPPTVADISNSSPNRVPLVKYEKPEDLDRAKYIVKKMQRHLDLIDLAIDEAKYDLYKATKTLQIVLGSDPDEICFPTPENEENASSNSDGKSDNTVAPIGRIRPVVAITNPNPLWKSDEPGFSF
jgi:hypothetical protein